jgi:hypothetical protein
MQVSKNSMSRPHLRIAGILASSGGLLAAAFGCEATKASGGGRPSQAPPTSSAPARTDSAALVAIVDGREAIDAAALAPALSEIGGATALREAVVDARLARRISSAGIVIDQAHIAREEELLLETLDPVRERALDLLGEIRDRQGLGPRRFAALLARNAGLRALVEREVQIDDAGLENMYDLLHGPKRVARIAVLASLADAQRFADDASSADAGTTGASRFAELAVERSLDESAARGGLLAPVARRDPSYPEVLRAAIYSTPPGTISAPILDGSRFYVVMVVEERPADGTTLADARPRCERLLRISRERLLMDALARELASPEGVTIFDRAYDARR